MSRTFLVVGATGKQGGAVINALLDDESASSSSKPVIKFLTRNTSSEAATKLSQRGCEPVKGDLSDTTSLDKALQGVDAAFLVTNPMGKGGAEEEGETGVLFVKAAKKAGIKHLVFSSVHAADTATSVPHFQSKWKIEQAIEATGIPYTILRPVAFMDNFGVQPGAYRFLSIGAFYAFNAWQPCQFIAVSDIGKVGAKALLNPEGSDFKNKRVLLSAGEYSFKDTLDAYEKAQGSRPWVASLLPTWLVYALPYDFKQMMLYFRKEGYPPVDLDKLRKIIPGLLSLQDWVAENSKDSKAV